MQGKYRNFAFNRLLISLKFVSVSLLFGLASLFDLASVYDLDSASASIISSKIIAESSIILTKYFPFSQLHVAGFKTHSFSHTWHFLDSHQHISLFHHWSELHFLSSKQNLHSTKYVFLMFSFHYSCNNVENS